jgi:hypothetical protein
MKQTNQSRSGIASQWLSGFTALTFLFSSVMPAQAQTTGTGDPAANTSAGQVITGVSNIVSNLATTPAVFNQTPQQLQMQSAIADMKSKMDACALKAVAGSKTATDAKALLADEFKSILGAKSAKAKGQSTAGTDQLACYKKAACDSECGEPRVDTSPVCGSADIKGDTAMIAAYIDYLSKTSKCSNAKFDAIQKQKQVMDCQMQVLQAGVNQASQALQQVLQANAAQYGQMNQYMGELADQGAQIDALIGEKGKLTGLQAELYKNLNSMIENEAKFKNDANSLDEQTKQNAAFLAATKAQKFGSCMFGATASTGAVQCWRPKATYSKDAQGQTVMSGVQKNKNGCPVYEKGLCSPAQAARSAIEMSYLTSNGQPYQDADRCADAETAATNFDNQMNDISGKLGTDLNSWSDIQSAYGASINPTAMSYLQRGAATCTVNADNWAKNAQNPNKAKMDKEAQQYAQKDTELKNMKNTLSASLDAGMTGLSKGYADVMAALSDQPVSLNRVQCTKDNPTVMQDCYAKIRTNLQGLLEGNSDGTTTTKTIKGGTMTPGFAVPCQGLNGCITTFQTVRDKIVDQSRLASQAKQKYVQDGNAQVMAQLNGDPQKGITGFSQFLATTQQSVMKQYDQLKDAFAAMGITPPDSPKMMDPEQLEAMDGPNNEKGPYKQPKSMAAVLSGMVQPGGLINFSDPGMKESFAEAQEALKSKKSGNSDTIKEWKATQKEYVKTANECSKDRVGKNGEDCNSCRKTMAVCQQQDAGKKFLSEGNQDAFNTMLGMVKKIANGKSISDRDVEDNQSKLDKWAGGGLVNDATCSDAIDTCNSCFSSYAKNLNGSGDAGSRLGGSARSAKDD